MYGLERAKDALRELDDAISAASGLMLAGAQAEGRHDEAASALRSLCNAESAFAAVMADAYDVNEFRVLAWLREEDE